MKKLALLLVIVSNLIAALPKEFKELFDLSNQIRGSSYECQGIEVYAPLAEFLKQVESDYLNANLEPIKDHEAKLNYFKYWHYLSFDNYVLYKKFFKLANEACAKNFAHFNQLLPNNADELCSLYVQRFEDRAFGSIKPPYRKLASKFSKFLALDGNDAISFLSMSDLSELELEFILKIALLEHKSLNVINFLIQSGASIDSGYESAIFYALDYPAAMRLLLANGADVNYANAFNKTALIYAIERSDLEMVKTLLRFGARVDIASSSPEANLPFYLSNCGFKHNGKTALMAAASSADVEILKLLISNNADINALDFQGLSALDYALIYEKEQNIKFLKSLKEDKSK